MNGSVNAIRKTILYVSRTSLISIAGPNAAAGDRGTHEGDRDR
jgi:hypothetical protein